MFCITRAVLLTMIVNLDKTIKLTGIIAEIIISLVEITAFINKNDYIFHIVSNTFLLTEDGISNTEFLYGESTVECFYV